MDQDVDEDGDGVNDAKGNGQAQQQLEQDGVQETFGEIDLPFML